MTKIGYKQTKEHRINIGLALKNKKKPIFTKTHRKNMSKGRRGIEFSEEHIKNLKESLTGRKLSDEHKKNIRLSHIGKSSGMLGKSQSDKTRKKIGLANKNKHLSIETKKKIGIASKNRLEKSNKKIGETRKKLIKDGIIVQIFPLKDTSIELKIQKFCRLLHLEYLTHCYVNIKHSYRCDIFIPVQEGISQKTIIECDGDAFHFNPKYHNKNDKIFKNGMTAKERWKLDNDRTKELIERGFRVIRIWEDEIKIMNLEDFKNKLNNYQEVIK